MSTIMRHPSRRLSRSVCLVLAILAFIHETMPAAQTPARPSGTAMTLDVDATDAPMKILHATLSMAARPGPMTLFYPKWIPGEHMSSGPIANLTGLHLFADGNEIIAVNARRFSHDELERALRASKDAPEPIELIGENGGYFKTVKVDYHGGLKYPHLERAATASDVLTAIAKARQ